MDKVTFQDVSNPDGVVTTYAIIDKGNGEFTSMTKEYYDAQQAKSVYDTLVSESSNVDSEGNK